jgi:SAM-dependent methyltransferase
MTVDVLHTALTAPTSGEPLLIERTDGHTSAADLDWWLRQDEARPPADLEILARVVDGPVLDVGCCTGRHLEHLARRGIEAEGIDICDGAVALARSAGLTAEVADVHHYHSPHAMKAVLALGGGIGLAGTREDVPRFLERLASWVTRDGMLLVSSIDWTATIDKHRAWVDAAIDAGRYPGEVSLRLRYGDLIGDWFDWVWVDPATLSSACQSADLAVRSVQRWGSWYGAVIERAAR